MTHAFTVFAVIALLAGGTVVSAHHGPSALGQVRLTQPVMAGGTILQAGTYDLRLTGEHVTPLPGQSGDAEQHIELVKDGIIVARDVAVVMGSEAIPVGTSGATSGGTSGDSARPRVDLLKGGDFLRISVSRDGERYLVHLPVAK